MGWILSKTLAESFEARKPMRTIVLYGSLGEKYGREHRFKIRTPAEAIRALCANFPGFYRELLDSEKNGVGYRVLNGKTELEKADQIKEPSSGTLRIIPVVIGAGGPVGRILIGAALITAAVLLPAAAPAIFTAGSFAAGAAGVAFNVGVALTLGGVAQLLSPAPPSQGPQESADNQPSYIFNGPVNTIAAGHPVPVGYGRMIVGGAVVSAGISTEQLKMGQKRVQTASTVTVSISRLTGQVPPLSPKIPANWFKRVYSETVNIDGEDFDRYIYHYYTWTLVDV